MKLAKLVVTALCPLMFAAGCASMSGNKEAAVQKNADQAASQVTQATEVLQRMESDVALKSLLQNARGIFIVPKYGQAALGIGANLAEGIVLIKNGTAWSDPAFFNSGGLTAGLQAGAEAGAVAIILNNDKAVQEFMKKDNFQLSADAGLTVVDWEKKGSLDISKADIIAWSDVKGLFGGAAVGLRDVRFDQAETNAFYGRENIQQSQIFSGELKADQAKTAALKQALTSRNPASVMSEDSSLEQAAEEDVEQ